MRENGFKGWRWGEGSLVFLFPSIPACIEAIVEQINSYAASREHSVSGGSQITDTQSQYNASWAVFWMSEFFGTHDGSLICFAYTPCYLKKENEKNFHSLLESIEMSIISWPRFIMIKSRRKQQAKEAYSSFLSTKVGKDTIDYSECSCEKGTPEWLVRSKVHVLSD
ncbi:hypothetical protein BD560DRAFT_494036 [Blakeslea trispora]|nr:hypothetical protein BD560DRAFT_494036 [Blakeslea trispora]